MTGAPTIGTEGKALEQQGGGVERCRGRATRELDTKGVEEPNRCLTVGVVVGRNGTSGLGQEDGGR
mgnify:CR=1 FL=1